jgi:hypothetical protein
LLVVVFALGIGAHSLVSQPQLPQPPSAMASQPIKRAARIERAIAPVLKADKDLDAFAARVGQMQGSAH